uniref:Uncharacterized protein n=1 Tax=Cacopsylla melanoneura TaxID=428564 RepID=A0A8D8U8X8_9HEMI
MGEMCSIRLRWLRVLLLASGPCSLIYLFTSLRCDISETQPTSPTIPPSCSISFDLPTISISSSLFHRLLSLFVPIPTTISLSLSLPLVPCSLSLSLPFESWSPVSLSLSLSLVPCDSTFTIILC